MLDLWRFRIGGAAVTEAIYFDDNVVITDKIATIFGTSYPIGAITSIAVREDRSKQQTGSFAAGCFVVIMWGTGLLFTAFSLLGFFAVYGKEGQKAAIDALGHLAPVGVIGVIAIIFARAAQQGRERREATPPDYVLTIVTAAGERAAMISKDRAYIDHVRAAIEHAIQSR